jgi:hypothetical protein
MTKEELKVKLEVRAAKKAQEQAEIERTEKELYDQQTSRLAELATEMRTDIELERMMRANGICNANFCWDGGNSRYEGVGFEALSSKGEDDLRYIVKNLYASGLSATDTLVAFNPWNPSDGFQAKREYGNFKDDYNYLSAKFVEDFCNRYEGFHEDYHAWLSSGDWDDWDISNNK